MDWTSFKNNKKANKALQAIKLIKKHFNHAELKTLITSNFYSVLYYNAEIWLIPSLKLYLKNLLLSASARALKICPPYYSPMTSFVNLQSLHGRATPAQFMIYKHSLLLFELYNNHKPSLDWLFLNLNQNFNTRETNFRVFNNSRYKVGKNKISERVIILNGKIPLDWLNHQKTTFKINCKQKFLPARLP